MSPYRWKRAAILLAAVSLSGLACTKNPEVAPADKSAVTTPASPAATPTPTQAAAPAKAPPANPGAGLAGIPGMDFSSLPPAAQRELANVFSDEFCYCGCPHTLGACLRQHTQCKHAKRMARLSASAVADGAAATEVINRLSQYYAAFRSRVEVKVDARMCMGDANAPVTLAEFSDFECPYCAKARPLLEEFARKNPSKVRFCYLPFPLPMHANALPAAQAVLWARDQGKFWEMHDALFANQQNLSPAALSAIADKIGLPGARLQEALKAGTYMKEVEGFRAQGQAANLRGTPSLFFNGRAYQLEMGLEPEQLAHSLEDELEWRTHNNAWAAD